MSTNTLNEKAEAEAEKRWPTRTTLIGQQTLRHFALQGAFLEGAQWGVEETVDWLNERVETIARDIAADQLDAAARALYENAVGIGGYESLDEGAARTWRVRAAVVLRAAGFTVPEEVQP